MDYAQPTSGGGVMHESFRPRRELGPRAELNRWRCAYLEIVDPAGPPRRIRVAAASKFGNLHYNHKKQNSPEDHSGLFATYLKCPVSSFIDSQLLEAPA
jgi:hypothetical protein